MGAPGRLLLMGNRTASFFQIRFQGVKKSPTGWEMVAGFGSNEHTVAQPQNWREICGVGANEKANRNSKACPTLLGGGRAYEFSP